MKKKKTITKLVLRKETIKSLVDTELARVVGGDEETTCPDSRPASGCLVRAIGPGGGHGN